MGGITDLAKALFPSRAAAEEEHVYRWRVIAAITLWGTVMSLWMVTALAFGLVQVFGFTGFATKAEAQQVQQLVKDIRVSQLENQLRDLRVQQCQAQIEGNQTVLRLVSTAISEKNTAYWQLTGRPYTLDSCDTLLVFKR